MSAVVDESALSKPGTVQYDRKWSLIVSNDEGVGVDLSELRITFVVVRGDFQNPNSADIRVYNLSREDAKKLSGEEYSQLVLQAGYPGNMGIIFMGQIAQSRIGRLSQTDSYVDFTAYDGDEAYNFATVCAPLVAGKNVADRSLAQFLQAMKANAVGLGHKPPLPPTGNVRGYSMWGNASDELRDFAADNNMLWSIQDGQLTLIPQNSYLAGDVVVISPDTGLVATPEQTQSGIQIQTLLNPSIKIGTAIKLESTVNLYRYALDFQSQVNNEDIAMSAKVNGDGLYYVMTANHRGDTRGANWYTDLTCLAIDASVPVTREEFIDATTASRDPVKRR